MKDFFQKYFSPSITLIFKRFPLSASISIILFLIFAHLIISEKIPNTQTISIILSLCIWFFLSLSVPLFQEKTEKNITISWYIFVILYCIGFYFFNFQNDLLSWNFDFFGIHFFAFLLFPLWIWYSWKKTNENQYINFFSKFIRLLFTAVGISIILIILGNLALWAVWWLFNLYHLDIFDKLHAIYSVFIGTIFLPFYGMIKFPKMTTEGKEEVQITPIETFITKYIGIPFIIIYFIILYIYSIKILLNFWEWPRGIVSYLVIIFSGIWYFTYISIYHLLKENRIARVFEKFFPYAVLFQLPMLFYSIYLRINQYGLTTNRYVVVIIGVILLIISLYFIFSKIRRRVIIPALFSIIAIFVSIGPWGIFSLPYSTQFDSLKKEMISAEMYKDGKIFPFNYEKFNIEQAKSIKAKIEYLYRWNYRNNYSSPKLEKFFAPIFDKESWDSFLHQVTEELDLTYEKIYGDFYTWVGLYKNADGYIRHNISTNKNIYPLAIDGYDYLFETHNIRKLQNSVWENFMWSLKIGEVKIGDFSLKEFLQNILTQTKFDNPKYDVLVEDLSWNFENENFTVKLIPNYLPIDYKNNNNFYYGNSFVEWKILIKDKKWILKNSLQK